MAEPTCPRPRLLPRTLAFAALGLITLAALWAGRMAPAADSDRSHRGLLYRSAGDTYLRMYYLAGGPADAEGQYRLAVEADPGALKSVVALSMVLHEQRRAREAGEVVTRALARHRTSPEREALRTVRAVVAGEPVDPAALATGRALLDDHPSGPLVLARAYETLGDLGAAAEQWQEAERRGRTLLPPFIAMGVVVGSVTLTGLLGLPVLLALSRRRPALLTPSSPTPAAWGIREAVEALVLWLFLGLAASTALVLAVPHERADLQWMLIVPTLAAGLGAVAWVVAVTRPRARLGWVWDRPWRSVILGVMAAGLSTLPVLALNQVLQELMPRGPVVHPLVPMFAAAAGWPSKVALILSAVVAVPVLEETLFRGVLYRALRRQWSFAWAGGASAAVFAVAHLSPAGLLPYWLMGLLFALLYERTGSLAAPAAAHGAFNACNMAILLVLVG